ncbi:CHC2 zinc finger domain-containing protein [Xanthomonas albilineans]|uniref:CHC2 zinc finger domain-containing protein n=1 Tax=Xanthomonas albilineans TaxID=29447 RepID=UPI000698DB2E|nr:CHC2 zinc finger domain-containing protein [Xanthomonas albilineans]
MIQKRRSPHEAGHGAHAGGLGARQVYSKTGPASARLPDNWRDRLPDPARYFGQHVDKLGKPHGNGWAQGRCPFHEDRNASLGVNLANPRGGWKCFAGCGSGDLVSFHMRRTGLPFKQAARELLRLRT